MIRKRDLATKNKGGLEVSPISIISQHNDLVGVSTFNVTRVVRGQVVAQMALVAKSRRKTATVQQ